MKSFVTLFIFSLLMALSLRVSAADDHDHGAAKDDHQHEAGENHDEEKSEEKHQHAENEDSDHDDDHGHEENDQVGPGKGIVSASEKEGIQISPQAEKNFEIQRVLITSAAQFELPKSAVVTAGTEVNLYRYRSGHYKRVDFEFVSKSAQKIVAKSKDIRSGDEIVVRGMGLLRIAELAAFGGAPEGHSH